MYKINIFYYKNQTERPETSKCSRQQNQLNKTLTNFRQKQGTGGGGGDQQVTAQHQQNLTQKTQTQQPVQINNGIISDRQQSRSGTRQGRNNNSFQTTGQGFFRETFYKESNTNNNNNGSNISKPVVEEGMTLDKFFGSNFQVAEDKPNRQNYSVLQSHSDSIQQNYNPKNNKNIANQDEDKHQRSQKRQSKDESLSGDCNIKISALNKNQIQSQSNASQQGRGLQQNTQPDENSHEYKEYMEEEFEIHETDEEYSESYRESQVDLNMTENLNDQTQNTNKSKRKSVVDKTQDKSFQQDYSLTGKGIKQYLTTQESGDENQIKIQKKLRDKYSKKMRHKSFNATSSNSHQNNNLESTNQSQQSANSILSKTSQNQSKQNQNSQIGSNNHNTANEHQTNNGKGKFSTNNTSQSNSNNYSSNVNGHPPIYGQNERGSLTCIDESFEAKSKNTQQNGIGHQKDNINSNGNNNNTNILNSTQKRQKSVHENPNQNTPYKSNTYYQRKDKQISGNIKDVNLNNSYIHSKQSQQSSNLNHSLSLNQQSNELNSSNQTGDLQTQNSFQIEKQNKNYNIRKLNKSQSPPIHDQYQPLVTHSRNFSKETTQINSNQNQNTTDNSQNNSMQNTINQTNLQNNTTYQESKNNTNNVGSGGINHSQILNSCSGDSFKQSYLQSNNSHVKVLSNPANNNSQYSNQNGPIPNNIQYLQRKSKYGEFLDSQNDKVDNQKQFRASFYQLKQGQQQQQSSVGPTHGMDGANFTQISQSFANGVIGGMNIQNNSNANPILAPLNSLPTNNSYYNSTSKNRLTLNEFYKHQSKYEDYSQPNGPPQPNKYEEFIAENLMRRTAKENKFLNQKEKLNELIKKEDINFVTKYAARFNLNTTECKSLILIFDISIKRLYTVGSHQLTLSQLTPNLKK